MPSGKLSKCDSQKQWSVCVCVCVCVRERERERERRKRESQRYLCCRHDMMIMMRIYIYILSNSPYDRKKPPKTPASDLKMKIYNESLSREKNIYIGKKYTLEKKKRPTLSYLLKKIKTHSTGWLKEKKNTVRAAKLQCKKVLSTM